MCVSLHAYVYIYTYYRYKYRQVQVLRHHIHVTLIDIHMCGYTDRIGLVDDYLYCTHHLIIIYFADRAEKDVDPHKCRGI